MNLVEKLKDNEAHRIFVDMTGNEQECLRRHKEINVVEYLTGTMKWSIAKGITLYATSIYRIKPDYQPNPGFVDLEITEHLQGPRKWLGILSDGSDSNSFLPYQFTHLRYLLGLEEFEGFYLKNGRNVGVEYEWVARYHPNVIARFRT